MNIVISLFFLFLRVLVVIIVGMLQLRLRMRGIMVFLGRLNFFMMFFIRIVILVMYLMFFSIDRVKNRRKISGKKLSIDLMLLIMLLIIRFLRVLFVMWGVSYLLNEVKRLLSYFWRGKLRVKMNLKILQKIMVSVMKL